MSPVYKSEGTLREPEQHIKAGWFSPSFFLEVKSSFDGSGTVLFNFLSSLVHIDSHRVSFQGFCALFIFKHRCICGS